MEGGRGVFSVTSTISSVSAVRPLWSSGGSSNVVLTLLVEAEKK